ncbi:hypothetical protein KI387_026240 [Taxus chinensis]|uniref:Uncharacterized protein n=1 Tax=Taxus chinensis TaxID=29808 RepID=A0AA38FWR5_TAXCH|nr:hypothetical protein KI387_026240 [Taxus chinensis]
MVVQLTVPNNASSWQVFDSDKQIVLFLQEEAEFAAKNQDKLQESYGDQIIQLKRNKLPKVLVTLESIFNLDDQAKRQSSNMVVKEEDFEEVEVAHEKFLKIGKVCTSEEKEAFIKLCQEYHDIFSWSCKDLRGFDLSMAQHTIELDPNSKPIRQKQRPINLKIEPLMRKELTKIVEACIIFPIRNSSWVAQSGARKEEE